MSQMTVLIIFLVLIAGFGTVFVVVVARETERTYPELGDLPAARRQMNENRKTPFT